jgi:hypothetical protein
MVSKGRPVQRIVAAPAPPDDEEPITDDPGTSEE